VRQCGQRHHLAGIRADIKIAQRLRCHAIRGIGLNNDAEDFADTRKVIDVLAAHEIAERVINVGNRNTHGQSLRFINSKVKLRSIGLDHRSAGGNLWASDKTLTEILSHLLELQRIVRFSGLNIEVQTAGTTQTADRCRVHGLTYSVRTSVHQCLKLATNRFCAARSLIPGL